MKTDRDDEAWFPALYAWPFTERFIGCQVEAFVLALHDNRYMLHGGSVAYRAAGRCLTEVAVAHFYEVIRGSVLHHS